MSAYGHALLQHWTLEPGMRFLNHGSFGATPRELLEVQARWRARMEAQPVRFFIDELPGLLRDAASQLAAFVGTAPARLGFVENASTGVCAVIGSLALRPGDQVLTTDHVYNAVRNAMRHEAGRAGAEAIEVKLGMPLAGPESIVAAIETALSARTKLLVIDHIASPSAIVMPVERIVALARSRGVPVLVDGAHGPGMVDLNVDAIGADWYVGNCHKWLCAPKGAGFIAASPKPAFEVHPTVISHSYGLGFTAEFDKIGTRDATAWLTVPDAIKFHERLGGAGLRARNATLARDSARQIAAALGTECGAPDAMFGSMATIRLPGSLPAERSIAASVHDYLWREHRIEAPVMILNGRLWIRISAQAYNEPADYGPLADALHAAVHALDKAA